MYRGGAGTTPVTTACPEDLLRVKTSYELSLEVKVMSMWSSPQQSDLMARVHIEAFNG